MMREKKNATNKQKDDVLMGEMLWDGFCLFSFIFNSQTSNIIKSKHDSALKEKKKKMLLNRCHMYE